MIYLQSPSSKYVFLRIRECPEEGKIIPADTIHVQLYQVGPPSSQDAPWSENAMKEMIDCLFDTDYEIFVSIMVIY